MEYVFAIQMTKYVLLMCIRSSFTVPGSQLLKHMRFPKLESGNVTEPRFHVLNS